MPFIKKSKQLKRDERISNLNNIPSTKIIFEGVLTNHNIISLSYILNSFQSLIELDRNVMIYIDNKRIHTIESLKNTIDECKKSKKCLIHLNKNETCRKGKLDIMVKYRTENATSSTFRDIIALEYNFYGQITSLSARKAQNIPYLNNLQIKIDKFKKLKLMPNRNEGVCKAVATFLKNNKSTAISIHQISIKKQFNELMNDGSIIILQHKKSFWDRDGIISLAYQVSSLQKYDHSDSDCDLRKVVIVNNVSPIQLQDLSMQIQLFSSTQDRFAIPNYFSVGGADAFYSEKTLDSMTYGSLGEGKLHAYIDSEFKKKCVHRFILRYNYIRWEPKNPYEFKLPLFPGCQNVLVGDKEYAFLLNKFAINDDIKYKYVDNAIFFSELNLNHRLSMHSIPLDKETMVLHLYIKKPKAYYSLYFWDSPIEVYFTLMHNEETRKILSFFDHFFSLCKFQESMITMIIKELVDTKFFNCRLDASVAKLTSKNVLTMVENFIDMKLKGDCSSDDEKNECKSLKSCAYLTYTRFIKPKLREYINCIFNVISKVMVFEEIKVITIHISRKKDCELSSGLQDSGYITGIIDFKDLAEHGDKFEKAHRQAMQRNKVNTAFKKKNDRYRLSHSN